MPAKPKPPENFPNADNPRDVLAYNIRALRAAKGWSQEELAYACALDRTYVSAVERSRWNVSLGNIERIAQALDVPVWHLLKPPERAVDAEKIDVAVKVDADTGTVP